MSVTPHPVPQDALMQRYVGQGPTYTDCYCAPVQQSVDLPQFIAAFYTTWLFHFERLILKAVLRKPIRDADIPALTSGASDHFAAWRVEGRCEHQILLCDLTGRTRSWFFVQPLTDGGTQLLFGSVVEAKPDTPLPLSLRMIMPLHRLYARALLGAAVRKLN